ncbi:hypothetical protein J0X14_14455 [Muricauda sp. CAU 1633]|uniref:hypothetical protein n=1 Tax=Allomuricauda sp. CAU 1633 TaxID=2816036 RepID=UPI001A8DF2FE|nr:hypothetical protein [Muricauda sp. CAU 1633]MBO0323507.1 hypothetical protein [Muricauda sp. CAU 1633]
MTLEERKIEFIAEVHTTALNKYSDEMISDFIGYWTELDRKKKNVMRFEGEKYFSMGRRLGRWAKNEKQWNTPKIRETKVNEPKLIQVDFNKYG